MYQLRRIELWCCDAIRLLQFIFCAVHNVSEINVIYKNSFMFIGALPLGRVTVAEVLGLEISPAFAHFPIAI